jgi:hypothetical protein
MTYKLLLPGSVSSARPTRLVELSRSTGQSVTTGDYLKFDTLRETSSSGIACNATTGEISLPGSCEHCLIASIEIDRNANTESFRIAWVDSGGTEITPANGGFDCNYDWHSSSTTTNVPNFTLTAVLTTSQAASFYLKCASMTTGSTMTAQTSIIITQVAL